MNAIISDEFALKVPGYKLLKIEADVVNAPTSDALWSEITNLSSSLSSLLELPDINKRPAIAATRAAYKACGKEPNRYRPAAEALSRRVVKGMDLYRTDAIVDAVNLLSLKSGHSIGAFDLDKIEGDTITLGVGREGEPYEGIGRGELNIAGMPVWRDAVGGFGTPTSDNERTKISPSTRRLLLTINIYGDEMPLDDLLAETRRLLEDYCAATNITPSVISHR